MKRLRLAAVLALGLAVATTATAQMRAPVTSPGAKHQAARQAVPHAPNTADLDAVIGGRRIAQRECGGCHAVGAGAASPQSPLIDAPRFADLWRRYPPGGLDVILREGMLRPPTMPEEGSPPRHPRMPMVNLEDDEVAQLKAYLHHLDPRP